MDWNLLLLISQTSLAHVKLELVSCSKIIEIFTKWLTVFLE